MLDCVVLTLTCKTVFWASECFEKLLRVTTDPDSSAYKDTESIVNEGLNSTEPVHYSTQDMCQPTIGSM